MKKQFVFIFVLFFIAFSANAQYKKMPFNANHYWVGFYTNSHHTSGAAYYYTIAGFKDSLVNSITYKYLPANANNGTFLRDDTLRKRVIILDELNHEHILYNFNKAVGDTAMLSRKMDYLSAPNMYTSTYTLTALDSLILSDGLYHKRFTYGGYKVIEGIGGHHLVMPYEEFAGFINRELICVGTFTPTSTIFHKDGIGQSCSLGVGVKENIDTKNSFSVFPNPAIERLNLEFYTEDPLSIIIQDIYGRPIKELNGSNKSIDVSDLTKGVYFVQVKFKQKSISKYFIKN
jgi:hypothetical protein